MRKAICLLFFMVVLSFAVSAETYNTRGVIGINDVSRVLDYNKGLLQDVNGFATSSVMIKAGIAQPLGEVRFWAVTKNGDSLFYKAEWSYRDNPPVMVSIDDHMVKYVIKAEITRRVGDTYIYYEDDYDYITVIMYKDNPFLIVIGFDLSLIKI